LTSSWRYSITFCWLRLIQLASSLSDLDSKKYASG
jgi:hypothetical protein